MKKYYSILLGLIASLSVNAQINTEQLESKLNFEKLTADFKEPFRQVPYRNLSNSREILENDLVHFPTALSLATDSLPMNGYVYLFPDTMARIDYAGTPYSFYRFTDRYHSAGDVLDLSSNIFNSMIAESFDSTTSYLVDSVYIGYYYNRTVDNVTDTLRLYISVEDGIDLKEGNNDEPFPLLAYDAATNAPKTYVKSVDVLLTVEDTAWYGNSYMGVDLGMELEPGQLMSVVINYIPGYEYSASSNYFEDCNPFVLPCTKELKSTTGHMMSIGLESDLKFNQGIFSDFYQVYQRNIGAGEVWNERYAAVLANEYWTKFDGENIATRYNHLDMWYSVSTIVDEDDNDGDDDDDDTVVGIQELETKFNLYPNPAHDLVYVESPAEGNSIEVFDVIGNRVLFVPNASKNQRLDLSRIDRGIYLIKVGNTIKRMLKN